MLIFFDVLAERTQNKVIQRRNWQKYSKPKLLHLLSQENFDIETETVQCTWNKFENILINIVDALAPLQILNTRIAPSKRITDNFIRRKINIRHKLLQKLKTN